MPNEPEAIKNAVNSAKTIAVVGLSSRPWRASYGVAEYMQAACYRIIPVNPHESEVLGEKAYPTLYDVPVPVDIVNIFRRAKFVPAIVEAAIAIGAKCVWMQEDVVHLEASAKAEAAGLTVAMDSCILKVHRNLSAN